MKEHVVESYFVAHAKAHGGVAIKLVPTFFTGLPDRLLLLPGGRAFFVELKKPKGGVVSPIQKRVHRMLATLGFPVHILSSKDEVDQFYSTR